MHTDVIGTIKAETYNEAKENLGQLIGAYQIEGKTTAFLNTNVERTALPDGSELNPNHPNGTEMNLLALVEVIRVQSLLLSKLHADVVALQESKKAGGKK